MPVRKYSFSVGKMQLQMMRPPSTPGFATQMMHTSLSLAVAWKKVTKAACTPVRPSITHVYSPLLAIDLPPPAMRQTWEETGIDLAERDYTCIGQLDDREIT